MRIRTAVLGGLLLVGCQGTKSTAVDGGACPVPASVTTDGFVDAYKTALCCEALRCDSWTSAGLDACRSSESFKGLPGLYALSIAAGIDAGTLTIDPAHAVACLQALASDGCSGDVGPPLECQAAMLGQPLGGRCLSPLDCAEGSCALGPSGCVGVCTADVACADTGTCSVWETCGSNGLCGPGAQAGETCAQNFECAVGLVCGGGVCVAPGPAGTPCTGDDECLSGTFCAAGSPGERICATQLALGVPCGDQNSGIACAFGSYCSNQGELGEPGTCMKYGDVGEPCVVVPANSGFLTCLGGLYCRSDGICEPAPGSGPCAKEGLCAPGDYCDENQQCQPLRQDGDPCDEGVPDFGCASGQCTSSLVCSAPQAICE